MTSVQKFIAAFPTKIIDCDFDDSKYDIDALIKKVQQSPFLQQANITLRSCINKYDVIMADGYKPFKNSDKTKDFMRHDYKPGEINLVFSDLDNIKF